MRIALVQNVSINDHRMVHTDGVARELVKRGYDVEVIIQKSSEIPQFSDLPYKIICLPGGTYSILGQLEFAYGLYKFLKKRKYDVIHAKNPFSSVLPILLRKSGAKVVYDVRGLWIDFGVHSGDIPRIIAPFLKRVDMLCMRKADRVIAISNELKNVLVERGLDEGRVDVIVGDGVDLEKIRNLNAKDIREYLGIEGRVIGYVGGIGRSRYSERIIEAFKIVHEEIGSAKLVMMGPCKEIEYFKNLISRLGVDERVFFTGFMAHDEALKFMKSFDVAVSYHEGDLPIFNVAVPTKILEYLANGCSIITTDQKMYKNLLTHEKDGYLTAQNPKSFAEGIFCVLNDEKLSNKISKNASITAEKHSFKTVTDNVENLYKRVLKG